jgi:hypothetical protein
MTTYTGKDGAIEVGGAAIGELRSFSVDITADTVEDTVMGDDWKTRKAMHKDFSGEATVLHDPGDTGQVACIIGNTISLELFPAGETSGYSKISGSAIVTGRRVSSQYDGLTEMVIQYEGSGAAVDATV